MTKPPSLSRQILLRLVPDLIQKIEDITTLKCVLRAISILADTTNPTTSIKQKLLLGDAILLNSLGEPNIIAKGLQHALQLGILLQHVNFQNEIEYTLCYPTTTTYHDVSQVISTDNNKYPQRSNDSSGIFQLYEENIGLLTPLIAESLTEADRRYPSQWIREAFKEAVSRNKRSWIYISRILERWFIEGKSHGNARKYSKKVTATEYIQRHGLPKE